MARNQKAVRQYTKDGIYIQTFESIGLAAKQTSVNINCIVRACRGFIKTAGNYKWRYANESTTRNLKNLYDTFQTGPVEQYTQDGIFVKDYPSAEAAAREVKTAPQLIRAACRNKNTTAEGFLWCYKGRRKGKRLAKKETAGTQQPKRPKPEPKKVNQYDFSGMYMQTYESISQAGKTVNVSPNAITSACKGISQQSGGYQWRYYDGCTDDIPPLKENKINQYDLNGHYLRTFANGTDAARSVDKKKYRIILSAIYGCCEQRNKKAYGYVWRFTKDVQGTEDIETSLLKIHQYDLTGKYLRSYFSITDAAAAIDEDLYPKIATGISACCHHRCGTAHGYIWRFSHETDAHVNIQPPKRLAQRKQKEELQ